MKHAAVMDPKCVGCDRPLPAEDLAAGLDLCPGCRGQDEPEDDVDVRHADFPDEPESAPVLVPLPPNVAVAAEAFGLERAHILNFAERGDTVTIVTVGGKRVRRTVEKDGRVVIQGPEGFRWVQSAVRGGGYVARDPETGRVMRDHRDGEPIRVMSPAQTLHPRDRGLAGA